MRNQDKFLIKQLMDQGEAYVNQNDPYEAIQSYQNALNISNINIECWWSLARLYSQTNNLGRALICYENALALNPSEEDLHVEIARVYKNNNDVEKATHYYNKARNINPNDPRPYLELAPIEKTPEASIACYQTAIGLGHHSPNAYFELAKLYLKKGLLEAATDLCGKNPRLNLALARSCVKEKQFDYAKTFYNRTIQLEPSTITNLELTHLLHDKTSLFLEHEDGKCLPKKKERACFAPKSERPVTLADRKKQALATRSADNTTIQSRANEKPKQTFATKVQNQDKLLSSKGRAVVDFPQFPNSNDSHGKSNSR
jgi:tetratricopeptide (TPR) repeat protein